MKSRTSLGWPALPILFFNKQVLVNLYFYKHSGVFLNQEQGPGTQSSSLQVLLRIQQRTLVFFAKNTLQLCHTKDERHVLLLKGMISSISWLEAAAAIFDLSSKASCPFHCSNSCVPWLLAGLSIGFLLAIVLAILALLYLSPFIHRGLSFAPTSSPSEFVVKRASEVDRRARLAGYVD